MTTLYLIRHGQYDSPQPVVPYRLPGYHLSQEGVQQARAIAERLAHEPIHAVFASKLERTMETAVIIAAPHHLIPVADDRLLEVDSPAQGKTKEFIDSLGGWFIYDTRWYKERNGETLDEIFSRIYGFVEEKRKEYMNRSVIAVTHGDLVMLLAMYYMGIPRTAESLRNVPYVSMASGFRIDLYAKDRVHVAPIGETERNT